MLGQIMGQIMGQLRGCAMAKPFGLGVARIRVSGALESKMIL
jgi:hypothetical protein